MHSGGNRRRRWGLIVPAGVLGVAVLTPIAALLLTTWLMGWRLQVVRTASMEPLYPPGTLVVVEPIDASQVRPGMVLVFRDPASPDRLVAHRVTKPLPGDPPRWQTQGDSNRDPDPWPVEPADVRGHVRWGVPGLGDVLSATTSWPGLVILVGGPLGLLAVLELAARRRTEPTRHET